MAEEAEGWRQPAAELMCGPFEVRGDGLGLRGEEAGAFLVRAPLFTVGLLAARRLNDSHAAGALRCRRAGAWLRKLRGLVCAGSSGHDHGGRVRVLTGTRAAVLMPRALQ